MTGIGCPAAEQLNIACDGNASSVAEFVGLCGCNDAGNAITGTASTRAVEYIIDGLLAHDLALYFFNIPPSRAPGSHLVGSSNFKQLISPTIPLPGYTTSFG